MKALIVDGEEIFRLSLREVVSIVGKFTDIIEAASEHDFLAKTASHSDISLVILHPESLTNDGRDWIKLVRRLYPSAAILSIISKQQKPDSVWASTHVVPRDASVKQMISAIRKALRLPESSVAPTMTRPNLSRFMSEDMPRFGDSVSSHESNVDLRRLSYRQKQILAMAADGLPNKEIAARLSIAEGTVKAHMHAIFKSLGVTNRTQAVICYGAAKSTIAPEHLMPSNGSAAQVAI